ncbi:MAG: right-handed parallel beta-helix repeat-containing protein [Candidatus Zixiibacteriota bacterium]
MIRTALIGVFLSMLIISPCSAETFYISKSGSDSYSGTNWSQAWATIAKVNSSIQAGDTIRFGSGTWYQSTIIPPTGGMTEGRTVYACSTYSSVSERSATISAGALLTGWANYSGNIYYATHSDWGNGEGSYIVTQADSQLVYSGSLSGVTSAGKFFEDVQNNRVYVWCFGNANPNTQTMVVGKSGRFAVLFNMPTQDKITFFGLRLSHGCHSVVHTDAAGCDHNEFKHCTMAYWGGYSGSNTSAWLSEQSTLDSAAFGQNTLIQACSLYCGMTELGRIGAHTVATYGQHRVIIDSCTAHSSGNGIYLKDQLGSQIHYGHRVSFSTIHSMEQTGVQWTSHAYNDSLYGNIIYDCVVGINNLNSATPPIYGHFFICNNTIYDVSTAGIAIGDDSPGCGESNQIKYNIIAGSDLSGGVIGFWYTAQQCQDSYTIDSNMYYNPTEWFDVGEADHSFNNWQNHGYDVHGYDNIDPGFADPSWLNPWSAYSRPGAAAEMNRADYGDRHWTVWGAVQPSTGGCDPPGSTTLMSPSNGASNLDQPILFDWSDVGDADVYQIQIDNNSNFSSPEATYQTSSSSQSVSGLAGTTTYYWRVRSYSNCGGWGNWSTSRSFSTADSGCDPPGAPTVMSPPNGASDVAQPVPTNWNDVSTATLYNLQVDNNSDFSSPNVNVQPSVSQYSVPATLTPSTAYYWRVRSYNSCGWGGWSSTLHFMTAAESGGDDTTPPAISNVHATDTTATTAQILWQTNELATSQVVYVTGIGSPDSTNETTTFVLDHQNMLTGLYPNTTYEYCVKSADSSDNISQSLWYYFRTAGFIVGADETQIEALGEPVYYTSQPTLVVRNVSQSNENAYYFEVATDSNFVNSVTASQAVDQQEGGTTGWKVSSRLDEDRDYYWRASANLEQHSNVSRFRVKPKPHTYPDPFNPHETPFVTFTDIPPGSTLKIKTLQGETVWTSSNDEKAEVIWDGMTDSRMEAAAGVYIWIVEDTDIRGKLTVIR